MSLTGIVYGKDGSFELDTPRIENPATEAERDEFAGRDLFRKIVDSQADILKNIVLYNKPETELDVSRLMAEFSGPVFAAIREYRRWLKEHPNQYTPAP